MNHVARMKELRSFEQLVHDVLLVDPLEDAALLDDVVKVSLHELEHQVQILVVGGAVHVEQLDNVRVVPKLFQEHNFPKSSLSVCSVPERIKNLFHCHHCARPSISRLPNHAVGSLAQSSSNLIFLPNVRVNVCGDLIVGHLKKEFAL